MSKRIVKILLVFILTLTSVLPVVASSESDSEKINSELRDHWARAALYDWYRQGLFDGYEDGTIRPDRAITRAEFIALLNRLFNYTDESDVFFTDIKSSDWFYNDVKKAISNGLINGYPDQTFRPNQSISRQEAIEVLYRAFQFNNGSNVASVPYTDDNQINDYAFNSIQYLSSKGYVEGYPDNSFLPRNPLTRAEVAAILQRIVDKWITGPGEVENLNVQENVLINTGDTVLKNAQINGNLYLTQGIDDGEVILDNVTTTGTTFINGGGENSIYINNSALGHVIVDKQNGKVRIVTSGATDITEVQFNSGGILDVTNLSSESKGSIIIDTEEDVELVGDFEKVRIDSSVNVIVTGSIKNLTIEHDDIQINGEVLTKGQTIQIKNGKIVVDPPTPTIPSGPTGPTDPGPTDPDPTDPDPTDPDPTDPDPTDPDPTDPDPTDPDLPAGPNLVAVTVDNVIGENIVLTFIDNEAWRSAITNVYVDNVPLTPDKYTVVSGSITLDSSVFSEPGTFTILIEAVGFAGVQTQQQMLSTQLWTLVWSDEFDGTGTNLNEYGVDLDKWSFQEGDGTEYGLPGWGNEEEQYYREQNATVEDGVLVIEAVHEGYGGKPFTSSKLVTEHTFSKTYGKFEARIKLPAGPGFWPAFWMMPTESKYGGWASSGEIDIMEARGRVIDEIGGTIHFGGGWPNNKYTGNSYHFGESEDITDFHVYSLEWEPGELRWYVDGELYSTQNNWDSLQAGQPAKYAYPAPFDQDFFMILNLAVGGTYDGGIKPGAGDFPAKMEVDYVRVYELTGRPYREPIEPVIEKKELPDNAKQAIDGNFIHDNEYEEGFTVISTDSQVLDEMFWNFAHISTFGGNGTIAVDTLDDDKFARINITQPGSQAHSIQLIQHVTLTEGWYYKLSFDAKSTVSRNITAKLGGGAEKGWAAYSDNASYTLSNEMQSFEFVFQMQAETDPLARLEFNLGTNGNPVWIGNVVLEEAMPVIEDENKPKEPLFSGEHIYNGGFNLGRSDRMIYWNFLTNNSADASVKVDGTTSVLGTSIVNGGSQSSDIQLTQQGINLLQNDQYVLSFKARGGLARNLDVGLMSKDQQTNYYEQKDIGLTTTMTNYSYEFTMPEGVTDVESMLVFSVGGSNVDVYISDVSLLRLTDNNVDYSDIDLFPLINGDFSHGLEGWTPFTEGGIASFTEENETAKIAITHIGGEPWHVMFSQENLQLSKGVEYIFSFDAWSSIDREIEITLETDDYSRYFESRPLAITAEPQSFEYTFRMQDDVQLSMKILLGKIGFTPASPHDVFIDNVVLEVKNAPVKRAPTLIPQRINNYVGEQIEIMFRDDPEWRSKIATISSNGAILDSDHYTVNEGSITFMGHLFDLDQSYHIVIEAEGFAAAKVTQTIFPADGNLILNGSMAAGEQSWVFWKEQDDYSDFSVVDETAQIKINYHGGIHPEWHVPINWSTQFSQDGIQLQEGKSYELSFRAWSTVDRPIRIEFGGVAVAAHNGEQMAEVFYNITSDEDAIYKMTLIPLQSGEFKLLYALGNVVNGSATTPDDTPHTIYLDDIALKGIAEPDESSAPLNIGDTLYFSFKDGTERLTNTRGVASYGLTVPSASGGNFITPNKALTFSLHDINASYNGGGNQTFYDLQLTKPTNTTGLGLMFQISYDFDGDGVWDRIEKTGTLALNPVAYEWESFKGNATAQLGDYQDFVNGRIKIEIWNQFGNSDTFFKVSSPINASIISLPYTGSGSNGPGEDLGDDPGGEPGGDPGDDPGGDPGGEPGGELGITPDITEMIYFIYADGLRGLSNEIGSSQSGLIIPSADDGNFVEPNNPISYTLEDITAAYLGDDNKTSYQLYFTKATEAIGNVVMIQISYDFDGDGIWDRVEKSPAYALTPDPNEWERFTENDRGSITITGSDYENFNNGKIKIELWNQLGSVDSLLKVNAPTDESRIKFPY